jgi:dihydrodipicolinate synthase/N-acetylneuraminate lyase
LPLKELKGTFPLMPLVLKKNQELDLEGLRGNIRAYEELGVQGYVSFGCMGEFYAVNFDEFKQVVDAARDETKKIACVFGTTSSNTAECVARTRYAKDAGADGVMVGLPYLIPCNEESAYSHFQAVNEAAETVQIMLYNNPFSFRFNISADFWDRLMELDRVKAVKESSYDVLHRSRVVSRISSRINVFSGGEFWILADSLLGANGLVSMAGPGVPHAVLELFDACMKRDLKSAIPLHVKFANLFRNLTAENEVAWLKACAEFGGHAAGPPRSPYPPLDSGFKEKLYAELREIESIAASAKIPTTIEI